MKLNDLLLTTKEFSFQDLLRENCSQFIYQSKGLPLIKLLPVSYDDFQKVKLRKRKGDKVAPQFNEAFIDNIYNLRQRALFANTKITEKIEEEVEPYFVFPINGYKFLYSNSVKNSNQDYKKSFDSILESMGNKKGSEVISDMLQFTYIDNENLYEGIKSGAEIIIYNIPYFYSVKISNQQSYDNLYSSIIT